MWAGLKFSLPTSLPESFSLLSLPGGKRFLDSFSLSLPGKKRLLESVSLPLPLPGRKRRKMNPPQEDGAATAQAAARAAAAPAPPSRSPATSVDVTPEPASPTSPPPPAGKTRPKQPGNAGAERRSRPPPPQKPPGPPRRRPHPPPHPPPKAPPPHPPNLPSPRTGSSAFCQVPAQTDEKNLLDDFEDDAGNDSDGFVLTSPSGDQLTSINGTSSTRNGSRRSRRKRHSSQQGPSLAPADETDEEEWMLQIQPTFSFTNKDQRPVSPWAGVSSAPPASPLRSPSLESDITIVKIQITPRMTEDRLGKCILQAVSAARKTSKRLDHAFAAVAAAAAIAEPLEPIEGLFRAEDGLFVTLEQILLRPHRYEASVWALEPCAPRAEGRSNVIVPVEPKKAPLKRGFRYYANYLLLGFFVLILAGSVASVFVHKDYVHHAFHLIAKSITTACISFPILLVENMIDFPLRELYRHGPGFAGGWEGSTAASICAAITYHGDESFWLRNMDECHRIFGEKEEAFLKTARPCLYLLLAWIGFKIMKAGAKTAFMVFMTGRKERKTKKVGDLDQKVDPDMTETYKAMSTLIRQVGQMMAMARAEAIQREHQQQLRRREETEDKKHK